VYSIRERSLGRLSSVLGVIQRSSAFDELLLRVIPARPNRDLARGFFPALRKCKRPLLKRDVFHLAIFFRSIERKTGMSVADRKSVRSIFREDLSDSENDEITRRGRLGRVAFATTSISTGGGRGEEATVSNARLARREIH